MLLRNMTFTPVSTKATGKVLYRRTSPILSARDRFTGILARCDIGRHDYRVEPGLYACGDPGKASPVLVTANYKLSFDSLRRELTGLAAWILVLDTKGINVWCAAGKGTFGTDELVKRVRESGLESIVDHRVLVVPQLGATGVAGYRVREATGFTVRFGPVYARDVPRFIASGMKKDETMREVRFSLRERLAVAPVEIAHSWPIALAAVTLAVVASAALAAVTQAFAAAFTAHLVILLGSVFAGTLLFPALLPYLPFRAFSAKGAVLGAIWCLAAYGSLIAAGIAPRDPAFAWRLIPTFLLAIPAVSYLAMNFTGSSTYTSQTGTELEVRVSLPFQIGCAGLGLVMGTVMAIFAILRH
jgi:CO dehydrogenase/acetyl-CoA synthase delta subunit